MTNNEPLFYEKSILQRHKLMTLLNWVTMIKNQRKNTRNKVWPDTQAVLSVRHIKKINALAATETKACVENLSGKGMFVSTEEPIEVKTTVDIKIDFQPGCNPPNVIYATGIVLRQEPTGLAIQFRRIDTRKLGECIMAKINSMP